MEQEIETVPVEEVLTSNLSRIVNDFVERDDTSVFAIGKAASKVIKGYISGNSDQVSFTSIVPENMGTGSKVLPQGTHVKGRRKPKLGFYEVELDEQYSTANLKNGMALSIMFKIKQFVVKKDYLQQPLEFICEQILSSVPKSMSYVLISAFGGDFAERLHRTMAKMLMKRDFQIINLVIIPARFEKERRKQAIKGAIGLDAEVGNVHIYDNDKFVVNDKVMSTDVSFIDFEAMNAKINRDIGHLVARLSERAALIRNRFEY
jgi:hypothetical protein